jgi:hypothetical protein
MRSRISTTATDQEDFASTYNPSLAALAPLVGRWRMELSGGSFESPVNGLSEFEWIEGGAAFVMRQGSAAIWIVGRDETEVNYRVHYADDRGVSRHYEMTLVGRDWQMWRITPEFSQRFEGAIESDRQSIRGAWKKSFDLGVTWEHDFNIDYSRISS